MKTKIMRSLFLAMLALVLGHQPALADDEDDGSIARCLKAWGTHPFGKKPRYKTLGTSVKIFGIGANTEDTEVTSQPVLVVVNPDVNIMGGSTIGLMNPNGWYCLRANVNVMGGVTIKAHCKAHLASATEGVTVLGSDAKNKAVTVMGKTSVELEGCQ